MRVRLITFGFIISVLLVVCLIAPGLAAQSLTNTSPYVASLKHFILEQGLPNRLVRAIGQDRQGFIWIGTQNNAYRFDGQPFSPLPAASKYPIRRSLAQ